VSFLLPCSFMDWLPRLRCARSRAGKQDAGCEWCPPRATDEPKPSARMCGSRRLKSLTDTVRSWFLEFPQNPDRVSSGGGWWRGRVAPDQESGRPAKGFFGGLFSFFFPSSLFLFYADLMPTCDRPTLVPADSKSAATISGSLPCWFQPK